jgi:hypothetical protein
MGEEQIHGKMEEGVYMFITNVSHNVRLSLRVSGGSSLSITQVNTNFDGGRITHADTKESGKQTKSVEREDGDGLMVAASMANLRQIVHWKVRGKPHVEYVSLSHVVSSLCMLFRGF